MTQEPMKTIADLEIYGLSIRSIELLNRMDCLYIADLEKRIATGDLRSEHWIGKRLTVREIKAALQNLRDGRQVKTVQECLGF